MYETTRTTDKQSCNTGNIAPHALLLKTALAKAGEFDLFSEAVFTCIPDTPPAAASFWKHKAKSYTR